ncbi:DNA-binding HxlR family transcriptional regulator [Amycolatopsis bartoniae]|uniref:winged helix-turn-helix transcriptional regulator n=1 Tax=Amycolatopsis bartoniae TaxID=941986 RepID=UPI001813BF12|nr:helix-turn-helix domain-containing protein [Amycolatopsis bartoniae]MBB2936065.1 DNA-binding HxlR family transcriptional regulator [Amycolatopsis bartoniae]
MSDLETRRPEEGLALVRSVLDRVGDKWAVIVVCALAGRTRRFNELRRACLPINQRMLSTTLRALERDGLVTRTLHPTVPPRVEYALTPRGLSFLAVARELAGWAEQNHVGIERSRADYDARDA